MGVFCEHKAYIYIYISYFTCYLLWLFDENWPYYNRTAAEISSCFHPVFATLVRNLIKLPSTLLTRFRSNHILFPVSWPDVTGGLSSRGGEDLVNGGYFSCIQTMLTRRHHKFCVFLQRTYSVKFSWPYLISNTYTTNSVTGYTSDRPWMNYLGECKMISASSVQHVLLTILPFQADDQIQCGAVITW